MHFDWIKGDVKPDCMDNGEKGDSQSFESDACTARRYNRLGAWQRDRENRYGAIPVFNDSAWLQVPGKEAGGGNRFPES